MIPVAVVTGAAGGIGRAIAERLAKEGYAVLGGDVAWPAVQDGAGGAIGTVEPVTMDVSRTDDVTRALQRAGAIGTVRAVVNCAGVLSDSRIDELTDEQLETQLAVNLGGAMRVCRAAIPLMAEGAGFVNIGSIAAAAGGAPGVGVYASTKAGLEGFTRALACELGPAGIRVNLIAPGFVRAPMSELLRSVPKAEQRLIRQVPLRRLAEPEEIAEVVAFLLSDRASYINGVVLPVDGGRLAW
jgi:3-oxoacyl-[acyl-carrier protein] reductase